MRRVATVDAWIRRKRLTVTLVGVGSTVAFLLRVLDLPQASNVSLAIMAVGVCARVAIALALRAAESRREGVDLSHRLRVPMSSVAAVSPLDIGVDPAAKEMLPGGDVPEYQPRDVDTEVKEALRGALAAKGPWIVAISGPSKVGKSRTLYQGLLRLCKEGEDLILVAPSDARSARLLLEQVEPKRIGGARPVLWLDDLEDYVAAGLTLETLRAWSGKGAIVAVTVGGKGADRGRPQTGEIGGPGERILSQARQIPLRATRPGELARLPPDISEADREEIEKYGLAAALVAAPALEEKLEKQQHGFGEPKSPQGAAVIHAAIDWARCGRNDPIPRERLRALWPAYLEGVPATDGAFDAGLAWALRPVAGRIALLVNDTGAFRPYDYIVGFVDSAPDAASPTEQAWREALDTSDPGQAFEVGVAAYFAGREEAEGAFDLATENEDDDLASAAYVNLGVLLLDRSRLGEAEAAFRQAADLGNPAGLANLGLALKESGDPVGAEEVLVEAVEMGLAGAAVNLGALRAEQEDFVGAEEAFRHAAEHDNETGIFNLALFLEKQERLDEAERWYREAARRKNPDAAFSLGQLLLARKGKGDLAEARVLLAEALAALAEEEGDDIDVELTLAEMLEQEGDPDGAEAIYRKRMEAGDGESAARLGQMLKRKGDIEGAEEAYGTAAELGDPGGTCNLGVLFFAREELDEAERLYRRAIELYDESTTKDRGPDVAAVARRNLEGLAKRRREIADDRSRARGER